MFQLVGLHAVAFTYPFLSFLKANPTYFVVNDIPLPAIYLIVASATVGLPALLIIVLFLSRLIGAAIPYQLHLAIVAVFATMAMSPLTARLPIIPGEVAMILAILVGGLILREYTANRIVHWGFALLMPLCILFPIQYLHHESTRALIRASTFENLIDPAVSIDQPAPIVFVVFDELPMLSLLDAEGSIDETRYPNFARLANQSDWYTRATTVHDYTTYSIPSMLTGMYPSGLETLPIEEEYPSNIFSLLKGHYEFHAHEEVTAFARLQGGDQLRYLDWSSLFNDLAVMAAHAILPSDVAPYFGRIDQDRWGNFREIEDFSKNRPAQLEARLANATERGQDWGQATNPEFADHFNLYLQAMENYPPHTLHFVHLMIPHRPHVRLPSGRLYNGDDPYPGIEREHHKMLLQVVYADALLGKLLDRLKELDLFDESLIVVTSDHGIAFNDSDRDAERDIRLDTFAEIGSVPILIKKPQQQSDASFDRGVQTIDIVPTVSDILGVQSDRSYEGHSLVTPESPGVPEKRIYNKSGQAFALSYEDFEIQRAKVLERNRIRFNLDDPTSTLFQIAPTDPIIGQSLEDLITQPISIEIPEAVSNFNPSSISIPALVHGTIADTPSASSRIGVAVNGTVYGVTDFETDDQNTSHFYYILNDAWLDAGRNDIQFFVFEPEKP